jgi:DNA-binding CsgD family transcriptional regulator
VYGGGFALFITFSLDIFDILLWCLLAFVVFQGHTSSVVVFGFGRGVFTLGGVLGWAIGVWLLPNILVSPWASIFFVLMATLVIICAVLVFSEKDFDQLFSTALPSKLALNEFIRNSFISTAQLEAENEPGSSSHIEACKEIARTFNLTEREQDIFNLLARGRGSEIIALRLQISLNTVRSHTQNIYIKTGVHSRNELIEMVEFIQQNGDSGRV